MHACLDEGDLVFHHLNQVRLQMGLDAMVVTELDASVLHVVCLVEFELFDYAFFYDDVDEEGWFWLERVFLVREVHFLNFKEIVLLNLLCFLKGLLLDFVIKVNVFVLRVMHFFYWFVYHKFFSCILQFLKRRIVLFRFRRQELSYRLSFLCYQISERQILFLKNPDRRPLRRDILSSKLIKPRGRRRLCES